MKRRPSEINLFAKVNLSHVSIDVKETKNVPFLTKNGEKHSSNSFYDFVHWGRGFSAEETISRCFIVPSSEIYRLKRDIEKLNGKRSDKMISKLEQYLNRWNLLEKGNF